MFRIWNPPDSLRMTEVFVFSADLIHCKVHWFEKLLNKRDLRDNYGLEPSIKSKGPILLYPRIK